MPNRELSSCKELDSMLDNATLTTNNTTVAGGSADLQGCDAATVIADIGEWGDTGTDGWEIGLQESDDDSTWTDVADADLTTTVAGASTVTGAQSTGIFAIIDDASEDDRQYKTGYIGSKRYIRPKLTATGNQSTGTPIGVFCIKEGLRHAPQ